MTEIYRLALLHNVSTHVNQGTKVRISEVDEYWSWYIDVFRKLFQHCHEEKNNYAASKYFFGDIGDVAMLEFTGE